LTSVELALLATGVWIYLPLSHLPGGLRVTPYDRRPMPALDLGDRPRRDPSSVRRDPLPPGDAAGLALLVTEAFCAGHIDLGRRAGSHAPLAGWDALAEVVVAGLLREAGANGTEVRHFLSFAAAMNRGQDPDQLWLASLELFRVAPWAFDPAQAAAADPGRLAALLVSTGLSATGRDDSAAWRVMAARLAGPDAASPIGRAIGDGEGDAASLLDTLAARSAATGGLAFPLLGAQRTASRWIRMLALPGGAAIADLAVLPLTVDASVRRASECLGVTRTRGRPLDDVRAHIQEVWRADVARSGTVGPPEVDGTVAALDPALTFLGRWGCFACEQAGRRTPVSAVCDHCQLGAV
jgi:hypothetical protein